jgi:TIR domain
VKAPAHVFISYVGTDSSVALGIAKELRQLGQETWTYEENGLPGHSYLEQVHAAIGWCDAFVLLASTESLKSHQVRREAETAYEQQKFVIPIRLKVTHEQLHESPIFRMVSGTAVSLPTDGTDLRKVAERVATSLRKARFQYNERGSALPDVGGDATPQGAKASTGGREPRTALSKSSRIPLALMAVAVVMVALGIIVGQRSLFVLGVTWLLFELSQLIVAAIRQRNVKKDRAPDHRAEPHQRNE